MAKQYKKTAYSEHCSNDLDCTTHSTTFGLSDAKCPQHCSKCTQTHNFDCHNYLNIIRMLTRKLRKLVIKRLNATLNTTSRIEHNILSNGLVIQFVQLNKMQRRTRSYRKCGVTKHFVHSIEVRRSYHKNIERNKVCTLGKWGCLCWLAHSYG